MINYDFLSKANSFLQHIGLVKENIFVVVTDIFHNTSNGRLLISDKGYVYLLLNLNSNAWCASAYADNFVCSKKRLVEGIKWKCLYPFDCCPHLAVPLITTEKFTVTGLCEFLVANYWFKEGEIEYVTISNNYAPNMLHYMLTKEGKRYIYINRYGLVDCTNKNIQRELFYEGECGKFV